jgi:hypothetical protein
VPNKIAKKRSPTGEESLAHLLVSWINDDSTVDRKELAVLMLESVRDDVEQAVARDSRKKNNPHAMRNYLDNLITDVRRLLNNSKAC